MVDFVSLGTGLKTAYEIARSAKDVNDQAKLNSAIADIMDQLTSAQFSLFDMQQQHQALIDENRKLKEEIAKKERFKRYRLEATPFGGYIFRLIPELAEGGEPDHAICPKCKEEDKLSLLSRNAINYFCQSCEYVAFFKKPEPRPRRGSRVVKPRL